MLTREQLKSNRQYSPEIVAARSAMKNKGWSYRTAAVFLGVTYQHICLVLTEERQSKSLLRRIHALPHRRHTSTNNH